MARRQKRRLGFAPGSHRESEDFFAGQAEMSVRNARAHYEAGHCLKAGKAIDNAYAYLGAAGAHSYAADPGGGFSARHKAATYDAIKRIDEKFEKRCVKRRPS